MEQRRGIRTGRMLELGLDEGCCTVLQVRGRHSGHSLEQFGWLEMATYGLEA